LATIRHAADREAPTASSPVCSAPKSDYMPLPRKTETDLALLASLLESAASSDDDADDWHSEAATVFATVVRDIEDRRLEARRAQLAGDATPVEFVNVAARTAKQLREEAGWTQQDLADAMVRLGFITWKRITVAESESGKRRLSTEELCGLSILFAVPVAGLLTALRRGEVMAINEQRYLNMDQLRELVHGYGFIDEEQYGIRGYVGRTVGNILGLESPEDDWTPGADVWGPPGPRGAGELEEAGEE
jgi:transcriptional regulator with XRE-family HTH domain